MTAGRLPQVLVVDEPATLRVVARVLQKQGYEVLTATDPRDGLDYLQAYEIHLVLTDLRIERAAGRPLLTALQRYPPQAVAMVLTGPAGEVSLADALREGAYDFLPKPFDPDLLKAVTARGIERATLARAIRELVEELEERVAQATAELRAKVQQLDESRRRLEEAQRQREAFIAMVVHELGGPLTAVAGYAEVVDQLDSPPKLQERARTIIIAETRRMARLVQDLADAAELAQDRFRTQPTACDLAEVAREQVELARARTSRHVVRLEAADAVLAVCDVDRIGQVLGNLLTNAIKYSPGGEVRVQVWAEADSARISVSDQGPGIPPDKLEAVFAPGVRLAAGGPPGAGLGLHIARSIVETHGGRIWAESAPGQGASFHLRLPRASRPGSPRDQAATGGYAGSATSL